MSVLSTLALMVSSLVRPKTPDVVVTEFQAQIDELTRQRDEARIEADRWRALCSSWRQRYEIMNDAAHAGVAAINEYQQRAQIAQQCAQMLGAQNLQLPAEWCNCVPARHNLLTRL